MDRKGRRARRRFAAMICMPHICAFFQMDAASLAADARLLPTPAMTIYPGDTIKDDWLTDREFAAASVRGNVAADRSMLIGKRARRTLLPGAPVPINAVAEPKLVSNGSKVRVVFEERGLSIVTYGAALQDGGAGDVISLRNLETGLTISGVVQSDGSVRVNG